MSAWGSVWGSSWGETWGSVDVVVEQPLTGRGNWRLGRKKKRKEDDEVIEARSYEAPFEPIVIIEQPTAIAEEESDEDKILLAIARILH